MTQAKHGDRVRVHYTGMLDNGCIFDTSEPNAEVCGDGCGDGCGEHGNDRSDHECGCGSSGPMEFVIGQGTLLARFEEAVVGLEPGQTVRVRMEAADAYGEPSPGLIVVVPRSEIPEGMNPRLGDHLEVTMQDGTPLPVRVTEAGETGITLDANHPLAGMPLTFDIRLVEIVA